MAAQLVPFRQKNGLGADTVASRLDWLVVTAPTKSHLGSGRAYSVYYIPGIPHATPHCAKASVPRCGAHKFDVQGRQNCLQRVVPKYVRLIVRTVVECGCGRVLKGYLVPGMQQRQLST